MQTFPTGWPADSAVEVVPDIVADFGASTPGAVSVADWSIERQLTGSLLPGQVRAGSGFSVASGSVAFPQTTPPLSPWGKGSQKLIPGGKCSVYATHDVVNRLAQGSFIADKVTGSVSDPAVHAELVEDQSRLRRKVSIPGLADVAGTTGVDAIWLIDQIARSAGYYSTPKPTEFVVGSLPLQGSITAERGSGFVTGSPIIGWQSLSGGIVYPRLAGGSVGVTLTMGLPIAVPEFVTANVIGTVTFTIGLVNATVNAGARTIRVGTGNTVTYAAGETNRIQLETYANRSGSTYTSLNARIRTSHSGAWSAWSTQSVSIPVPANSSEEFNAVTYTSGGGVASGIQVATNPEPGQWVAPNAFYDVTGVTLDVPVVPAENDGWETIQQVAAATLGGAWVSEAGVLTYRGRDWMRGVGTPSETIVSETSLEDVAWSIGGDDVADRVTVNYQPPDIKTVTDWSLTVWEATEAVEIYPGGTVTVNADIEGTVKNLANWLPVWDTGTPAGRFSRWAAATSRDGGGAQPADTALQVSAEVVGTSRIRIKITNTTAQRLWTVDGSGNPTLIVRANMSARAGETVSLSIGADEDAASNPLSMDLGAWVQRYTDAQAILDWAWSQVQEPRAIIEGVRVKPNLARQLGDIVRITDETTALSSKALITGVHLSGSHGQYTQTVDLVLLDVTFYDLSANLGAKTFAQLSAEWAGLTFAEVSDRINSIGA